MGFMKLGDGLYMAIEQELGMVRASLARMTCGAFKTLLEDKCLYQNVKIKKDDCKQCFEKFFKNKDFQERFEQELNKFRDSSLAFGFELEKGNGYGVLHQVHPPQTINTACEVCKCVTPHNPRVYQVFGGSQTKQGWDETIVLDMQCQKCKQGSIVVAIRRVGLSLQLVGRNQIDMYVPNFDMSYIQDSEQVIKLFSESVMAERTGSHLAAICLLRVALEQYMRAVARENQVRLSGEDLYDRFDATLPSDFPRGRVDSLKTIYGRLSEIMHAPALYQEGEFIALFNKIVHFLAFVKLMPPKIGSEDCNILKIGTSKSDKNMI